MMEQWIVVGVLVVAMVLFVLERWRYDLVALGALLVLVAAGAVPGDQAFAGLGHPAVVTVAAILVVSHGLGASGLVEILTGLLSGIGERPLALMAVLTLVVTVLSGFMNNVGALALLLPVALNMADRRGFSPSLLLMPLAFGSLLGGMTTLIGTPPNIIIGSIRAEALGEPFGMFDYSPVGVAVAAAGLAFMILVGWRLIPVRERQTRPEELFRIQDYVTELRVPDTETWSEGRRLDELTALGDLGAVVAAVLRRPRGEKPGAPERLVSPAGSTLLLPGDHLLVEGPPETLEQLIDATGLESSAARTRHSLEDLASNQVAVLEAVVMRGSPLVGSTAVVQNLRGRHGINLLALARRGRLVPGRLKDVRFEIGDVLLVQCDRGAIQETLPALGTLPLAERDVELGSDRRGGRRRRLGLALSIFGAALATLVAGLLPAQVAFSAAALAMVVTGLVPLGKLYRVIDWPVIILLGAMIPVGGALETSGAAETLARAFVSLASGWPVGLTLGALLLVTMMLSDVMNNAATAVIMAPVAISLATALGASPDPFLMAVAVGASCAFLTPIGHQSNTLVMGPGGYRFGDYWRLGLPLEILVTLVSVPALLFFWPP